MFLTSATVISIRTNGNCKVCSNPLYGQRRKFCSKKCSDTFHNAEGKLAPVEAPRSCVNCSVQFFKSQSGLLNYCSKECRQQKIYEDHKNPMSTYGSGKRKNSTSSSGYNHYQNWCQCAYSEVPIDNDVLNHIEYLATDEPYVEEDIEWLERVLREEQTPAKYADGSQYKPDPLAHKLRMNPKCWWHRRHNLNRHRRNRWWREQKWGVLRKTYYGKRKKSLALVKVKPT